MKTLEQTTEEILGLAAQHFKVPREQLAPGDDFYKKLKIDSLQAALPQSIDPRLAHYLQRRSYDKALEFIENTTRRSTAR